MASRSLLLGLILLSGASLTACNRKGGSDALEKDPFATTTKAKGDEFGKGFGKAYRADPRSEPVTIKKGDLIPVTTKGEPVQFN